jgi:hypothetical protein
LVSAPTAQNGNCRPKTASDKAASKHYFALSALGGFIWFLAWTDGPAYFIFAPWALR